MFSEYCGWGSQEVLSCSWRTSFQYGSLTWLLTGGSNVMWTPGRCKSLSFFMTWKLAFPEMKIREPARSCKVLYFFIFCFFFLFSPIISHLLWIIMNNSKQVFFWGWWFMPRNRVAGSALCLATNMFLYFHQQYRFQVLHIHFIFSRFFINLFFCHILHFNCSFLLFSPLSFPQPIPLHFP